MSANSWADVFVGSLQHSWAIIAGFLPQFVGAIIVLIFGVFVAWIFRVIAEKIVKALRVDDVLRKLEVEKFFERAGIRMSSGKFLGGLVYWFFIFVMVLAVSDILSLWGLSTFMNEALMYFPNIIVAALILLTAIVLANFLRGLTKASVMGAKLHASKMLGTAVWWVTIIFGFFAALLQLGIATPIIQTIITGFIAMLTIAGGIAFGLGGRDYAAHLIELMREHTEGK